MKGILTRLVREAADQKRLATVVIFLVVVARELIQQTWSNWFELEPAVGALIGSMITPAILSLLVYVILTAYERQEKVLNEQKKRLEEAEKARLALDTVLQMSATVQHEINNPLMVITGNVDLILKQDPANSRLKKVKEAVARIHDVTKLLSRIKRVRLVVNGAHRKMLDLEASVIGQQTDLFGEQPGHKAPENGKDVWLKDDIGIGS